MMDTLLLFIISIGLSFGWTSSGQIKMDSATKARLESNAEFQKNFSEVALDDIIITDDDDPSQITKEESQK